MHNFSKRSLSLLFFCCDISMVRSDFLIMALLCEGSSQAVARGEVCLKHDMILQTRGIKLLPRSKATDAGRIKNRIRIFRALNRWKESSDFAPKLLGLQRNHFSNLLPYKRN